MPTNKSPGRKLRLSVVTRSNVALLPRYLAPIALAAETRSSMAWTTCPAPKSLARDLDIIEGVPLGTDLLIGFVSLSCNQHHIVPRGRLQRLEDRAGTVRFDQVIGVRPGNDIFDDGAWIFGAGIVAGNDRQIRQARRDFSHQGSLAPIAIAPAAKHALQFCARSKQISQRPQRFVQRIRRVGIIDDDQRRVRQPQQLHAAWYRLDLRKRLDCILERHFGSHQYAKDTEQVCRVELADQRAAEMRWPPGSSNLKFQSSRIQIQAMTCDFSFAQPVAEHSDP